MAAVDSSADLLRRLQQKASEAGVAEQLSILHVDLDTGWPALGKPDLVWASASLHHLTDPDRILRLLHHTLTPGGLLVVVEPDGFPRFLPDHAPEDCPGLEGRLRELSDHLLGDRLPYRGNDFGPMLMAAGFSVEGKRTITASIEYGRSESVGRYARTGLGRIRDTVADALSADDLAALDQLLDTNGPHSLLRRDDLAVRTERRVWAARA